MAASGAVSGYGITFDKGGTDVAEVTRISGVGINRETIEVTHLSSDNEWKEFIFGLKEGTDITIDYNFLPTNSTHKAIITDIIAGTSATYTTTLADTSTFAATMLPFNFTLGDLVAADKLSASAQFKITGAVTYTASA
jgi:predicted secreted protein